MKNKTIETPSGKTANTENFPVGSILIRADLRKHVHAAYIFARAADDISDNKDLTPEDKITRLQHFEKVLLDPNDQSIASVIPLRQSLEETSITPQHALDLVRAFKQDAHQNRYKDWNDLLDYCRYSASPVGRHVLALHGIGKEAWPANDALCSALQIINHLQDCGEDYIDMNRVYIPQDIMRRFKTDVPALKRDHLTPEMRQTIDALLDRMDPMMEKASTFIHFIPDIRLKMEVSVIYTLAEKLVKRLRSEDPLRSNKDKKHKIKLGKFSVFLCTLRGIARALFSR